LNAALTGFFEEATREQLRLRLAIDGPSGSGKSVTVLRFALALARDAAQCAGRDPKDPENLRIAVICTERRSARKYAGMDFGDGVFKFRVRDMTSFSPTEYTTAIEAAGGLGADVCIVDGLSQAWEGKEGALEMKDRAAEASGNSFTAWKDVTPAHRRMVDAILTSPCHMLVTMRSKTAYVLDKDETTGRTTPRRVGVAPVQRAGMEYEFDVYASMDWNHMLSVSKTRCPALDGRVALKPGAAFMAPVLDWLHLGTQAAPDGLRVAHINDDQMEQVAQLAFLCEMSMDRVRAQLPRLLGVAEFSSLREEEAARLIEWLKGQAEGLARQRAQPSVAVPIGEPAAPSPTSRPRGSVRDDQLDEIVKLRNEMFQGVPEGEVILAWRGIMERRGVVSAQQLSAEQAADLIKGLAYHVSLQQLEKAVNNPDGNGQNVDAPQGQEGGDGAEEPIPF
jgi:hypothetical protein